jgi:hypothetical protein
LASSRILDHAIRPHHVSLDPQGKIAALLETLGTGDEQLGSHCRGGERAAEVVREERHEPLADDLLRVEPLDVHPELLHEVPQLVLALACRERRVDDGPEGDEPDGALENGHRSRTLQGVLRPRGA